MKDQKIIDSEITRIYKRDGSVKPSVVVDEARPKSAPLHSYFTWNDKQAATEFRLHQARKIIRVARILVDEAPEQLVHVPRVESRENGREGYYKPGSVIAENLDEFTAAMDEALRKMRSARQAVEHLEKVAGGRSDETLSRIAIALRAMDAAANALRVEH